MADDSLAVSVPKQRRSLAAFERILAAGAEILAEGGYEAFQLQAVATRSGVSIGSIYGRVSSKEALFWAIYERWAAQMEAALVALFDDPARWEGLSAAALFEQATTDISTLMLDNADLLRVVIARSAIDPRLRALSTEHNHRGAERFRAALGLQRAAIAHPQPDEAIDVAFRLTFGTVSQWILYGPEFESEQRIDRRTMTRELAAAVRAYLLGAQQQH